jgi:N-acetylglucosamine-6-phosphate deacetylase
MNTRTITGRSTSTGQPLNITVVQDHIQTIEPGPPDETAWLSHGFIDLQINGYSGCDFNGELDDPEIVIALAEKVIATGTTTFIPTVITASEEKIVRALATIARARRVSPLVAYIMPFVHLEGPFISPIDGAVGAHEREFVRPPSLEEFARWQAASGDLVGMVTLSPHWENSAEFIRAIADMGIRVSIGHTLASQEQIHAAAKAGATLSTHLGNGIAGMLPRHPNPIWTQLADDRLTATFIADGHHVPADALKAMVRAKGIERSILISDVVALGGMEPGIYDAAVGGAVELSADGRVGSVHSGYLAGAARTLKDGIAWCAGNAVCQLGEAVRMATENPGRIIGHRGTLGVGAKADLVRFTMDIEQKSLQIENVLVEGVEMTDQHQHATIYK